MIRTFTDAVGPGADGPGADDAAWASWTARGVEPEAVAPAETHGRRPPADPGATVADSSPRRFRRTLIALIAVLAVVCAVLVAASESQGPKLDETQVDRAAVTENPGQQARLFVGGSIARVRASQVVVSPSTPVTVQTVGSVIAVQFTDRLAYSTAYTLRVRGVTSIDGSRPSTLETRFTTAPATVLSLTRTPGGDDRIVEAGVTAPGRHVIYQAQSIQAFGTVGRDLVVVTEAGGLSTVSLVARSDGTTEKLLLPGPGRVTSFAVDPPTGEVVFGFVPAGSRRGDDTALLTIPLSGNHSAVPLRGPGRRAVVASSWFMQQGSPVVLARLVGGYVVRIDLSLGGKATRVAQPSASVAARLDGTAAPLLAGGDAARIEAGSVRAGSTILYRPVAGTRVIGLDSSPNGQYVTVETAPTSAALDGYTIDPLPLGVTTLVIDAASGAVVASFVGAHVSW